MTTARKVFDIAMGLMDELSHDHGLTVHADTRDYLRRAPSILTALCGEIYKFSDTWESGEAGIRPVYPEVTCMDDEITLDGFVARTALPYGLAAHLLAEESPALASFFLQRYQGLIANYGGAVPTVSEPITNLYGRL